METLVTLEVLPEALGDPFGLRGGEEAAAGGAPGDLKVVPGVEGPHAHHVVAAVVRGGGQAGEQLTLLVATGDETQGRSDGGTGGMRM